MSTSTYRQYALRSGVCLLALTTLTTPPVALAADDTEAFVVEEVIVTAQRRDQDQTRVGIALSVFGERALERQGIDDLSKVAVAVPSFEIFRGNGSNNPTITLRGIGTTNPWSNNNPSVATYVDGVYLPFSSFLTMPLFDMQRIEVLKGPQIALYGRNAVAGAVNFISARPSDEATGYADVSYGSYHAVELKAAVSGPVSDKARLRLAGIVKQGGGYMDRPGAGALAGFTRRPGVIPGIADPDEKENYGDKDVYALRASGEFDLAEGLSAYLTFHFGKDKSELIGSTNVNGDRLAVFAPPGDTPFVDYDNVEPMTDTEQYGGVLRLDWERGAYTFSSITGFEHMERTYTIGDFVPTRIAEASFDETLKTFSQEVTVAYDGGENLQWLIGGSGSSDDIDYHRTLTAHDLLFGELDTDFDEDDKTWALFGQAEWAFNAEWGLTGGLRYTDESKDYAGGSIEVDPFGISIVKAVYPNTAGDGIYGTPSYGETNLSGKLALNWTPTDDALFYLSASKGFKSGGFDGSGITEPSSFTPFNSETLWTYELGTKVTAADGRLFFAGSVFYNDYSDKQVIALVDLGGGFPEAVIQNAAASRIYGADIELKWRVTTPLTFSLNGTLLDSKVTEWNSDDAAEVAAHVGNELPSTPDFSMTAKLDWSEEIGNGMTLDAGVWLTHTASTFRDIANSENLMSDSYEVLGARIDLGLSEGWTVYVAGDNLFDKTYVTSVRSLVNMEGRYYGAPRTLKAGVKYRF